MASEMKESLLNKKLSLYLLMGALCTLEIEIRRCAYNRKKYQYDYHEYESWNNELKENMKYRILPM